MKNLINIRSSFILIAMLMLMQSCKDELTNHYKDETAKASNVRLAEYIRSAPDLSKFYQMLAISGYDSILNASQTYTVWAPDNNALKDLDLSDTALVSEIVKNHVKRFSYSTSGLQSEYLKMINGKLMHFFKDDYGSHFGSSTITTSNILLSNGIVHILDSYIPYQWNIWEYIMRTPGLDSLKDYINSQHKRVFDVKHSVAVAIDTFGNTVYDSVFIETNVLFDRIGKFDAEDSVYTAILPDNTAWNEAYNRIKQFYITDPILNSSIQRDSTRMTIVKDMVFRNRIALPVTLDSLVSTTGNVFKQPASLFNTTTNKEVSNGLVYLTSKMPFKATDSWQKRIQVEAENSTGRTPSNANILLRYSLGSSMYVSRSAYIVVEPTTTSSLSKVFVDFSIPHTLSAKYNIYCVFVPGSIVNPNDTLPNRAIFFLLTRNTITGKWMPQQLSVSNNVTDPRGITKMLVLKDFTFPYCDPSTGDNSLVNVGLRVQNDVKVAETSLSRTMRIDYIILEPVSE